MDREKWLNGWTRSGKIVSMSNGIRCVGCGRNLGPSLTVFHEGYTPPEKDPDWLYRVCVAKSKTHKEGVLSRPI